ncbi:MAG: signal peptide peptidase SppA [Panacagrimonas sp.]
MSEKKSFISRFFGAIWGAVITIYRIVVVLGIVVSLGLLWMTFKGGPVTGVEDNTALVLWPAGDVVDQIDVERHLFERLTREPPSQTLLRDLTAALEAAATDPRIATVVLKLDMLSSAGIAQLEELVVAMRKVQAAGKTIHAYGPFYDQTSYFAAAAADDISIDPMGSVLLEGFDVYQQYYKDALDKLGVRINVFRVGEFKAAVEPFIRNDMSDAARRANKQWLDDLWTVYGEQLGANRKLSADLAHRYVGGYRAGVEKRGGDGAAYAKEMGLVTHVESVNEFRQRIATDVGFDEEIGSFRQIHYSDYLRAVERTRKPGPGGSDVALIVVQGEIVDGSGLSGQAGGDTIAQLLEDARRDEKVAAVVLRVDSPGGSAWASELIRREVVALRAAGKPVVASMGTVAASGGYWVSMDADQIWAHPATITGSIGIFGLIPTISEPLERLGIHTDGVGTTSLAGAFRSDRPLSADVAAIFQSEVEKGYRDFVQGVASGRKLDVAKVESIAQGRVWSGVAAKELGLVDSFGGLDDAARAAAKLAGLADGYWTLEEFHPEPQFPQGIVGSLFGAFELSLKKFAATQPLLRMMEQSDTNRWLQRFSDPRGVYAHCMCVPNTGSSRH